MVLLDILRTNYSIVATTDFQAIYYLHETLITLLVNLMSEASLGLVFELSGLEATATEEAIPEFTALEEIPALLAQLYCAFHAFANYNLEDRSVNGHNCRKSSILS